jgi:hypothetical protein
MHSFWKLSAKVAKKLIHVDSSGLEWQHLAKRMWSPTRFLWMRSLGHMPWWTFLIAYTVPALLLVRYYLAASLEVKDKIPPPQWSVLKVRASTLFWAGCLPGVNTKVGMSGLRGIDVALAPPVTRPFGTSDTIALGKSGFPIFRCLLDLVVWYIGLMLRCLCFCLTVVKVFCSFIDKSFSNPLIRSGHCATELQVWVKLLLL